MKQWTRLLGSLKVAVPLLVTIAAVLAWGTIYEATFGTAAVQQFVYHAWWFQALLGFLAVNLTIAALQRYPWKRQHLPFVLAHLGIILILIGGILGGRFGVEGQMIIPEGQAAHTLETPGNVLVVRQQHPELRVEIPTQFETQAWVHEPKMTVPVQLGARSIALTIDRYYPDAVMDEEIANDGTDDNPAIQLTLEHAGQHDTVWLIARDPERFGTGWGDAHVLFLEPRTEEDLKQLIGSAAHPSRARGVVSLTLPGAKRAREIEVPDVLDHTVPLEGTSYSLTFKDYFPDFALTEHGPASRSMQPNNPAVSLTLNGPEGTDTYLLFALHPEFQSIHDFQHVIPATVSYTHPAGASLPPNGISVLRTASGGLLAVLTDGAAKRQVINPVAVGTEYTHPSLGYHFTIAAYAPRAQVTQHITNRSNEVHAEMLHLIGREGARATEAWVGMRGTAQLELGEAPLMVEYRPAQRALPVTIKLLDFRKLDYPGTQMASSFESDVEMTDAARGIILMRTIKMNHPLQYRGHSFYQSSYIDGPTQTTILSVRSDPGTPFVYAGFLVVIGGVLSLFIVRGARKDAALTRAERESLKRLQKGRA
ncbi:MAG: cytochrome c biogenesis protein ResB [Candidatus Omnitrophica bacterium]|nr:cytochrome c biogenesis protein ResB [Candidatus Omnitrophota bacterium]